MRYLTAHLAALSIVATATIGSPSCLLTPPPLPPPPPARPQQDVELTPDGFRLGYERPGGGSTSGSGGGRAVDCSWRRVPISPGVSAGANSVATFATAVGVETIDRDGTAHRADPEGGGQMTLYTHIGADCPPGDFVWVSESLTARSLIPGLRIELTKILPLPVPDMSPTPEAGTVVNLGLWLAITDPGDQGLRLTDGPVWAEGNATVIGFTVDFGNGDSVDCEGLGTPYPVGSEIREEGPCGYTYLHLNPTHDPYTLTITSHYAVTYLLSDGETGNLGVVDRDATFDYQVSEIQIVGTGTRT